MEDTKAKRAEMLRMHESGYSLKKIAGHFGLHSGSVRIGIDQHKRDVAAKKRAKDALAEIVTYDDFMNLNVQYLNLSVRAKNCLFNYGIETVRQLTDLPDANLLKMGNFGIKSFIEIKESISAVAQQHNFPTPAANIKNIEPQKRKPSEVLRYVVHELRRMADKPSTPQCEIIAFAQKLEDEIR